MIGDILMGLFSKHPICSVCHEECDYPKYQLGDGNWLCQDCLKDAKLNKADLKNLSVSDIKGKINDQKDQDNLAVSMYRYAVENKFGSGWNETWGIKHFSVIAEHLAEDEKVLMTFIGLHNYQSATKHDNNYAYAITNKRIIMAQKNLIAGESIQSVYLDSINDITFQSGFALGIMTIDTIKEVFNVGLEETSAKAIHGKVMEILHDMRQKHSNSTQSAPNLAVSAADEIMKFKNLLDAGVITQEEFDAKKAQLLGL